MRFLVIQITTFLCVTVIYNLIKPYMDFYLPPGNYWAGYGAILIPALIYSYKNKHLFAAIAGCAGIWLICRLLDYFDPKFLAHQPILYACLLLVCCPLKQLWVGIFSGSIAVYTLGLLAYHWNLWPTLSKFEILIYNAMYFGLLTVSIIKGTRHDAREKPQASRDHIWEKAA